MKSFSCGSLQKRPSMLVYLFGLTLKKFDLLMELVKTYLHLISFPNSKVLKTYLLSAHNCYQTFMSPWIRFEAFIMDMSESKEFEMAG